MQYVFPVPRHLRATPSRCAVLSRRLARIADHLAQRGIRVQDVSRLRIGARLLARVADQGSFPADRGERRKVANAMRDSHEFGVIRKLLGNAELGVLAVDVQKAIQGTLLRSETARAPYQFQSQLWVGSVLYAAGLAPTVPHDRSRQSPDYIISLNGAEYGVEVKRPTKGPTIRPALEDAYAKFLDSDMVGGVAIDLSDCLDDSLLFGGVRRSRFASSGLDWPSRQKSDGLGCSRKTL